MDIGIEAKRSTWPLDSILQPYGGIGWWYLSRMQVRSPGPWAFVALRREYDNADYIFAQRNKIDARDSSFKFTIYDERRIRTDAFAPKVACYRTEPTEGCALPPPGCRCRARPLFLLLGLLAAPANRRRYSYRSHSCALRRSRRWSVLEE